MKLKDYLLQRQQWQLTQPRFSQRCYRCLRPVPTCYCSYIQKFDPKIKFVILIHPIEFKRRIASGRMSHLCLFQSEMIQGVDFRADPRIESLITNLRNQCFVLYPGAQSLDLSLLSYEERQKEFETQKDLVVFVVDGTWNTSTRMIKSNELLDSLPKISFSKIKASQFRVRRQPKKDFLSTLEAIHQTIELLGATRGFNVEAREHDKLLYAFNQMIERHIELNTKAHLAGRVKRYRSRRSRRARGAI